MWTWLASFLGGPLINGLINAYKAKLDAANNTGAQAADVAKAAILAEIEARKHANVVLMAEQGRWYTALPRVVVQGSFAAYVAKCVVYDNMMGMGSTDPLGGDIQTWGNLVMGFWFGSVGVATVASTIVSAWRRK